MPSRFARKFGLIGLAVGLAAALIWWPVQIADPFHVPTVGQAPQNYQEPLLLRIINDSVFVLCPGTLLQFFTLEMRGWLSWFMWTLAVLLNVPIYYAIGWLVETLFKGESVHQNRTQ